jgi:hypothetical protein
MKKVLLLVLVVLSFFVLSSCESAADRVSYNLSEDADQFRVLRKIVFYNGITDEYMFAMEGYCSIEADTSDNQLEVTCKVGMDKYEKHFLGLSDNVTYMVLQLDPVDVSEFHYKVYLRPQTLIPDIEVQTSGNTGTD